MGCCCWATAAAKATCAWCCWPDLLDRIVGIDSLSMAHPSEAQILANAREHFGNFAPRRPVLAPGQEYKPLGPLA